MSRSAIIYSPKYLEHDTGPQHPEMPSLLRGFGCQRNAPQQDSGLQNHTEAHQSLALPVQARQAGSESPGR